MRRAIRLKAKAADCQYTKVKIVSNDESETKKWDKER